jgi:hypothetical protein
VSVEWRRPDWNTDAYVCSDGRSVSARAIREMEPFAARLLIEALESLIVYEPKPKPRKPKPKKRK